MKRVEKIKDRYEVKYELVEEYRGIGIYQETWGCRVSESWLVIGLEPFPIEIGSYNHISKAEILDMVDARLDDGEDLGLRGFLRNLGGRDVFVNHEQGDRRI